MMTLLLIDDEPWMLELLPEKLREAGVIGDSVRVLTAATSEEALEHVQALRDGAGARVTVLADLHLGQEADGIDLLKEISRRLPRARCVLMSGHPLGNQAARMWAAHLDGFFEKPMRFEAWVPMVEEILGRCKAYAEA